MKRIVFLTLLTLLASTQLHAKHPHIIGTESSWDYQEEGQRWGWVPLLTSGTTYSSSSVSDRGGIVVICDSGTGHVSIQASMDQGEYYHSGGTMRVGTWNNKFRIIQSNWSWDDERNTAILTSEDAPQIVDSTLSQIKDNFEHFGVTFYGNPHGRLLKFRIIAPLEGQANVAKALSNCGYTAPEK
ncbi:hypothetical protein [Thioalkalivibrio sp. ALM2T]|uniref:hypothetical protein n=1 Tax=Thioalkalivibrio sp. ALM2T TaxID=1158184 RepID=UPI0012DF2C2E|nr:hypothetical protein [Thioalkalivibrio sp. ALM2T]